MLDNDKCIQNNILEWKLRYESQSVKLRCLGRIGQAIKVNAVLVIANYHKTLLLVRYEWLR